MSEILSGCAVRAEIQKEKVMQWNYDMDRAPIDGSLVFGCSYNSLVAVMYFDKDEDKFVRNYDHEEFKAVGWLEIPPINLAR